MRTQLLTQAANVRAASRIASEPLGTELWAMGAALEATAELALIAVNEENAQRLIEDAQVALNQALGENQ